MMRPGGPPQRFVARYFVARYTGPGLLLLCFSVLPAAAQPVASGAGADTTVQQAARSPNGALWRAAALPGWGQWYNGQYVKLPFVYAAFGGTIAGAIYANERYLLYRHAYLYAAREDADGNPVFPEYEADYNRLLEQLGLAPDAALSPEEAQARRARLESSLRQTRNGLRRNRDLLYMGIGVVYALSILDAYVSAHLLDFDVGEDLTVRVVPTPEGVAAAAHWNF